MNRRAFLSRATLALLTAAVGFLAGCATTPPPAPPATGSAGNSIAIVIQSSDAVASAAPVQAALAQVRRNLIRRGFAILMCSRLSDAGRDDLCFVVAGPTMGFVNELGVAIPETPGAHVITSGRLAGREVLLACGRDAEGLTAALDEIGARVVASEDPHTALRPVPPAPPPPVTGATPPKS